MLDVIASMKSKRIVVMGFMGSCPIAGVIWQHIHSALQICRRHPEHLRHSGIQ